MKLFNLLYLSVTNGYVYRDFSAIQMDNPKLQREKLNDEVLEDIFAERKQKLRQFCQVCTVGY